MNKVSIIVPVYNAYDKLDKCVESIINQTYKDIEILLINDGSRDRSIEKMEQFQREYNNIRIIDKENEGVAKTRNLGIKEASGDFVMFIDNDDYIDDDYVETYVNTIVKNDSDVVVGAFRRVDGNGKELYKMSLKNTYWSRYNIITPWAKIYRRTFLLDNEIEFLSYGIGEDVYFNILLYSKNPNVTIINYHGYNWLDNEESVSNTSHKGLNKDLDILFLLDKINDVNKNNDIYINYYIRKFYVWYLLYSGRNADKKEFLAEHQKIKNWLATNNIKFKISPLSSKINGELLKNRLIVLIFITLDKIKLLNLFAMLYCRG